MLCDDGASVGYAYASANVGSMLICCVFRMSVRVVLCGLICDIAVGSGILYAFLRSDHIRHTCYGICLFRQNMTEFPFIRLIFSYSLSDIQHT